MSMPALTIGDLTAPLPLIQGGMGIGISLSGLAAAVANAGGIGVIATAGIGWAEPDFKSDFKAANSRALAGHIEKARAMTKGLLGVNIMVALSNFAELVRTAVDHGADIIFSGAGLPLSLPKFAGEQTRTKLVPIISSARAATIICKKWLSRFNRLPDAFVLEGPLAGGHLGFRPEQIDHEDFTLEKLVPEVLEALKQFPGPDGKPLPLIAAGGIYTGADIHKFLAMGAAGVQMGTRFVATYECDASPAFKQAYVDAKEADLTIIKSPVGLPGRALRNSFVETMELSAKGPLPLSISCPYHCMDHCDEETRTFCISMALLQARRGALDKGLIFAGQNAHRVQGIVSVQELVDSLVAEYEQCHLELSTVGAGGSASAQASGSARLDS